MVVVTPTYLADLALFSDLHESFLRHFPAGVQHVVVTPERHLPAFRQFQGPRCVLQSVREVLSDLVAVPLANVWVDRRRPLPPLRGWIVQQLVKLAIASQTSEAVAVLADADVVFIRSVDASTFGTGTGVRFYRRDAAVDSSMLRHVRWHAVARQLLGLPVTSDLPLPDYISALNSWDPSVVRAMLRRVEDVNEKPWLQALGAHLHLSEFILYGVHCDEIERDVVAANETSDPRCALYWDTEPLTRQSAAEFVSSAKPSDVAVMISAKSGTPMDVRRSVLADLHLS